MSAVKKKPGLESVIVGISGASGAIYARRMLEILAGVGVQVHVIVTDPGRAVMAEELGVSEISAEQLIGRGCDNLIFHDNGKMHDSLASGSYPVDAMVICPCSSHTAAAISAGLGDTLLLRAAYVSLKQRRRLVLVHRENPLTAIDLENLLRITQAGGIISPASPGFYMQPRTIDDLVDSVVGRALDLLNVPHELPIRWEA